MPGLKLNRVSMMTSSNGNIFRVTGPLCGEFTGPGEFPTQRPVTRSFDVYFDLRLNKRLSKQSWGWWFETLLCSLWRHRNGKWVPWRSCVLVGAYFDSKNNLRRDHVTGGISKTLTNSYPLRAKSFRGNINMEYLHFMLLLHIDMTQAVEMLPQARQGPIYST